MPVLIAYEGFFDDLKFKCENLTGQIIKHISISMEPNNELLMAMRLSRGPSRSAAVAREIIKIYFNDNHSKSSRIALVYHQPAFTCL